MKKLLILTAAVIAAFGINVQADSDIAIKVNGNILTPEQPPVVMNNRTLVPVRAVCEAMGLTVEWHQKYQEVIIRRDEDFVKLGIGYHTLDVNHTLSYIDAAPQIVNGVTCVPIRYVVEPFGAMVDWDNESRTVIVQEHIPDEPAPSPTPTPQPTQKPTPKPTPTPTPKPETNTENKNPVISNPPKPSLGEKPFTFYYQSQEDWAFEANGRGYCWVCSYAMLISDLLGERVTPLDIAAFNIEKSEGGSGNYMASHFGVAEKYGLDFVPALSEDSEYFDSFERKRRGATYFKAETDEDVTNALIEALERNPHGIMVRFEGYPHTLVATGYYDGEVYFNDPGSPDMENVTFEDTCLGRNYKLTDLSFVQALAVK